MDCRSALKASPRVKFKQNERPSLPGPLVEKELRNVPLLSRSGNTLCGKAGIDIVWILVSDGRSRTIEFRDVDREWFVIRLGPVL